MDDRELRELCRPFQVKDGRGLAEIVDEFCGENPRMLEDLGTVSREIRGFLQARGLPCRGTVEGSIDDEDENDRCIFFSVCLEENTVEANNDLLEELVTHLAEMNQEFLWHILADIF